MLHDSKQKHIRISAQYYLKTSYTKCIKKKRNPNIMFKAYSKFSLNDDTATRELIFAFIQTKDLRIKTEFLTRFRLSL